MALIAVAALLSPLLFVSVPGQGLWYHVALNASHGPIFAVVAVLLVITHPPAARSGGTVYVNTFFVAIGLGILIEILQTLGHRPGQAFDVLTDAAGAAAGLGLWSLLRRRGDATAPQSSSGWLWPLLAALAGIAFVAWFPLQATRAYVRRAAVFPVVAEFRQPLDLVFVTTSGTSVEIVDLPQQWARRPGERALRIGFDSGHAPSVQVIEPAPDWRGYSVVAVDITNPDDQAVQLIFRILDSAHDWSHEDRLNLPLVVPPATRTTIRVALSDVESAPARRRMDLSRIANVMLFGPPSQEPGQLYVSRVWLE